MSAGICVFQETDACLVAQRIMSGNELAEGSHVASKRSKLFSPISAKLEHPNFNPR